MDPGQIVRDRDQDKPCAECKGDRECEEGDFIVACLRCNGSGLEPPRWFADRLNSEVRVRGTP